MQKLKELKKVNMAAEIKAMADFLAKRWVNVENIEQLFWLIADTAQKNAVMAITNYDLDHYLLDKRTEREEVLASCSPDATMLSFYDQPSLLLKDLSPHVRTIYSIGQDALYELYSPAIKSIKAAVNGPLASLHNAQPINLAKAVQDYKAGNEDWDKALETEFEDRSAFEGTCTSAGNSASFPSLVNVVRVVEDCEDHDTTPIDLVIRAAYAQLGFLSMYANTQAVIADLAQLEPYITATAPVFDLEFKPSHSLTKALHALAIRDQRRVYEGHPGDAYNQFVATRQREVPLSPQELAQRKVEAVGAVIAALQAGRKPETPEQARDRQIQRHKDRNLVQEIVKPSR